MQHSSETQASEPTRSDNPRYECKWRDEAGRSVHYWVDNTPAEPIWPPSQVMRWDLRPNDWHLIWAELVDHPCALLFAPKHPHRPGPPRFRDWVQSWPAGFDWRKELPEHLHEAVLRAQAEISATATEPATTLPCAPVHPQESPATNAPAPRLGEEDTVTRLALLLRALDDSKRGEAEKLLTTLVLAPDSARVIRSLSLLLGAPPSADPQ